MDTGIEFFDSNILIATSVARHIHHAQSMSRLASIPKGLGACAAHSLAETYNTLTKAAEGFRVPSQDAAAILQRAYDSYILVHLEPKETMLAIHTASRLDLTGPIIYDALILACARKVDASVIYTFNVRHFRRVAPDLASRIREP